MKFGLFQTVQWPESSSQSENYRAAVEQVVWADELGFDSVWLTEHHFSRHGIIADTFSVGAYLAARTKRIRLGPAVAVLPFHHPIQIAEEAATLDLLSEGRLNFGVGRGYQWHEFYRFGIPMEEATARFDEAMDIILRAWTSQEPFAYEGRFWSLPEMTVEPKPVQKPHPPVWVAAMSPESIAKVARRNWNLLMGQIETFEQIAGLLQTFKKSLEEAAHEYSPEKVILARALYCAESTEEARRVARDPYMWFRTVAQQVASAPDPSRLPEQFRHYRQSGVAAPPDFEEAMSSVILFGDPDLCIQRIAALRQIGIEKIIFFINFGAIEHAKVMRSLERFAKEVIPHFVDKKAAPQS